MAADPSAARKRRKAIIESQRKESEEAAAAQQQKETENEGASNKNSNNNNKAKPFATSGGSDDGSISNALEEQEHSEEGESTSEVSNKKRKGKRTQIRYDPDVPMSKEQLAAWRREARRVRNRESAAASRQRIRNRITELETEVDEYKSKYHAALDRLKELEDLAQQSANGTQGNGTAAGAAAEEKAES